MKKCSEIIKGLTLIFLVFVSMGIAAAEDPDEETHTVSVAITQVSESEDGDPVTNTYNRKIETIESTDVKVKGSISDNGALVTTNLDETVINVDEMIAECNDPVSMPDFELALSSPDEFNRALSLWISSLAGDTSILADDTSIINMDDFLLNVGDIVGV